MVEASPYPHQNAFVVVGDKFDPGLFGDLKPFGIPPDPQGQLVAGPVAQITYGNGVYSFEVAPNRVGLHMNVPEVFPEPLLDAAYAVAQQIDVVRTAVVVTGLGLNCDAILPVAEGGHEYCRMLLQPNSRVLGASSRVSSVSIQDVYDGVRYTRRYEPANRTEGRDLFLAINAHQDLARQSVSAGLELVQQFRHQVETIHGGIA